MLRPPHFGVELSAKDLLTADEPSILYGVTPGNKFIPIKIDSQGRLELSSSLSLNANLDLSGIASQLLQQEIKTSLDRLTFSGSALHVAPFQYNQDSCINQFQQTVAPPLSPVVVSTFTVPPTNLAGQPINLFYITKLIFWGDTDGVALIRIGDTVIGGGRTSPTTRTLQLDYSSAPLIAKSGQVVTTTFEHYSKTSQKINMNLLGELL